MTHLFGPSRARLLPLLLGVSLVALGCAGGGSSVSGGGTGSASSSSGSGGAGGAGGEAAVGATTGAAGGGGDTSCDGPEATIEQVRLGQVAMGERVRLKGVIAMTTKRLIVQGSGSGSCLWGVYVSAPGLTETQQNSGILVVDYGFNATIKPGEFDPYCPQVGVDPTGDDIPDDVRPGDQLDIVAEASTLYFGLCGSQTQLTLGRVCSAVATGTQPQPTSHVVDIASLSSLEPWEGVKIRAENVHPLLSMTGQIVQPYADIFLQEGGHIVGFPLDCQPGPPVYTTLSASPTPLFQSIEGIVFATICGWQIGPVDRCADLVPPSEDCAGLPGC